MKLRNQLLFLLVLLSPTQLSYHFWPHFAFINGLRIDYLSPTLYATDLLILALIIPWLIKHKLSKLFYPLFVFSVLNMMVSNYSPTVFFAWITFYKFAFLFLVLKDIPNLQKLIKTPLALALVYTALIAVAQVYFGHTLGGPFYYLGERTFSTHTPGIAKFTFLGREYLRPYATFPHPNVLAGFALVSIFLLSSHLINFLGVFLVLLSYSQNAWLALSLSPLFKFIKKHYQLSLFSLVLFSLLAMPFSSFFKLNSERFLLINVSGQLFAESPFLGVGLNAYLQSASNITNLHQPVHNLFLLVLAQAGLIGLLTVYYFLQTLNLTPALLAILLTGLFDHYWLTLEQTQLLLVIVFALSSQKLLK